MIKPLRMWAIAVRSQRSEWIYFDSVRRTRKEAIAAFLDAWDENALRDDCRAVKVTVSVEDKQ